MANFLELQKRVKGIKPSQVRRDFFRYIRAIEKKFFDLNIEQIEDSKDAKGKLLEHKNSRFSGVYTQLTDDIAKNENPLAEKKAGEPYNFLWTGDFLKGFELFVKNGSLELFSTGTGNGDKADFFDGYEHLFGLTDESLKEVIDVYLLPFLLEFYNKKIGI